VNSTADPPGVRSSSAADLPINDLGGWTGLPLVGGRVVTASSGPRARARRVLAMPSAMLLTLGLLLVSVGLGANLTAGSSAPGDLSLSSDTTGALVNASNLAAGHLLERCLRLSYGNAVDADSVKLFASDTDPQLADYLDVGIDVGSGGGGGGCAGFAGARTVFRGTLSALEQQHGTAQNALSVASMTAGSGSVSVRLSFRVKSDNRAQGAASGASFTWAADPTGDRTAPPVVVTPVDPPPTPVPPVPAAPAPAPPAPAPPAPAPSAPAPPSVPTTAPTALPTTVSLPPVAPTPTAAQAPTGPTATSVPTATPVPTPAAPSPAPASAIPATPSPGPRSAAGAPAEPTRSGAPSSDQGFVSRSVTAVGKAVTDAAKNIGAAAAQAFKPVAAAAVPVAKGASYGLGTVPMLGLFLMVQSRIDRRDPKLALAPVYADPDLTFNSVPRGPLKSRGTSP
jgi:hypothetical protein